MVGRPRPFVRHAFGLTHSPKIDGGVKVRVYTDEMPLSATQFARFKDYVVRLSNRSEFRAKDIWFWAEDITQVTSHDHDILQCLDVILGAMNFRLTRKHKDDRIGPGILVQAGQKVRLCRARGRCRT